MSTGGDPQKPQGEGATIATGFGYQQGQPGQQPGQTGGYNPQGPPQQPQFYQQSPQYQQQPQQPQYYQQAPQQQQQGAYGATPVGYQQQQPQQQGYQQHPPQGYQQQPQAYQPHQQQPVHTGRPRQPNECSQCSAPYPLPPGATSWRCRNCGHFQNNDPDCCTIL